ncbi:hypothetical protein [Terrisporobacter sp.]
MKKAKLINFLKEDKKEERIFKCTLIILSCLLISQCYKNLETIKSLEEDIKISKSIVQSNTSVKIVNEKSTLIKDTNKIYDLLGFKNVDRLSFEKNKVNIEGKCKSLDILQDLKSMDNVKKFSVTSVENKNKKFYFKAVYNIGGYE